MTKHAKSHFCGIKKNPFDESAYQIGVCAALDNSTYPIVLGNKLPWGQQDSQTKWKRKLFRKPTFRTYHHNFKIIKLETPSHVNDSFALNKIRMHPESIC